MKIAGIQANSFVDYEGNISTVVFTTDCNMNCWYCHNRYFLNTEGVISDGEALAEIKKRAGFIDAVVVTGGEPTLMPDVEQFIDEIKKMGLKVKLDTNGTNPQVLQRLLNKVDYVAMDIKAPFEKYKLATCTDDDISALKKSVKLIMESDIPYEFRTTYIPQLKKDDIINIAENIKGARLYALQQYVARDVDGKTVPIKFNSHPSDYIRESAEAVKGLVQRVITRGI